MKRQIEKLEADFQRSTTINPDIRANVAQIIAHAKLEIQNLESQLHDAQELYFTSL